MAQREWTVKDRHYAETETGTKVWVYNAWTIMGGGTQSYIRFPDGTDDFYPTDRLSKVGTFRRLARDRQELYERLEWMAMMISQERRFRNLSFLWTPTLCDPYEDMEPLSNAHLYTDEYAQSLEDDRAHDDAVRAR